MTSIELTEEHKSKLLEMCKVLFSEIKIHTGILIDGSKAPETVIDYPVDLEYGTEWDLPYISIENEQIHWLEFCLYYLVDKVFNEDKEESYMSNQDYYMGGLIYRNKSQNPIDILYEEFKKLKKNENNRH